MERKIWSLYKITNKINGKVYIGQAQDYKHRWTDHLSAVKNNRPTQIIHHALIKYGIDNFEFEVIASCITQDYANEIETYLVDQYDSFVGNGNGYNATYGGMNAPKTEEWKLKVSEKLMGHAVTQETRDKVSKGNTGKIRSDEFKKNVSIFHKGKEVSEDTRRLLSEINIGNKNCLGNKHSEETKKKLSEDRSGDKGSGAKLTWEIVNQIRLEYIHGENGYNKLSKKYNVTSATIQNIVKNITWKII